ncbi:hypothetical protein [Glycomyces rhizosphaerae]|uniref:Uncharacterized protein n=1 Tax=Glycomyces rhizosphaerae TaxID=2054422 RepID=A0ABV7Q283_9ACTN
MSRRPQPSPVRTAGRHEWGRTVVAGCAIRMWADLRNRRTVIQLDTPESQDVGVVVTIGDVGAADLGRPVLLVNPQQRSWAGTREARIRLLDFAVRYFRDMEASA